MASASSNPFDLDRRQASGKKPASSTSSGSSSAALATAPETSASASAAPSGEASGSVLFPAREWSPSEQAEKLSGYLEVPPELWDGIRYGTHVRYFTKADGFRIGGFVQKNPYEYRPKGSAKDRKGLRLQNGFNSKARGYATWFVDYETLDRLYIKPDAAVLVMIASLELAVKGLNENIRKLAEHQKKMEARISAIAP